MVCLPLIAEQNAHQICLAQECLQIVRRLLWSQATTLSLRNINPMLEGSNLCVNFFGSPSTSDGKILDCLELFLQILLLTENGTETRTVANLIASESVCQSVSPPFYTGIGVFGFCPLTFLRSLHTLWLQWDSYRGTPSKFWDILLCVYVLMSVRPRQKYYRVPLYKQCVHMPVSENVAETASLMKCLPPSQQHGT